MVLVQRLTASNISLLKAFDLQVNLIKELLPLKYRLEKKNY